MSSAPRKNERRYSVEANLKALDISRADSAITLTIRDGSGNHLGTAEIGQGSFGWKVAHGRRFKRVPWGDLAGKLGGA